MPGGSLPGVSQSFGADASGYLAEVGKVIAANRELVASTREVQRALGEIAALRGQSSGGSGQDVAAEFRRQMDAVRSYGRALGEAKDATGGFTVAQAAGLAVARDHAAAMAAATRAAGDYAAAQAATRTASDAITASLADQARAQATANDAAMVLIREHLAGNAVLRDSSTAVRSYGTDLGDLGARADSATTSLRNTASAAADLAVSAAAASAATGGGGIAAGSLTDVGRSLDQMALNAGFASYRDLMRASLGAGGGAALAARAFYGTGPMSAPSGSGGGYAGGLWPAAGAPGGGGGAGGGGLLTAAGYADAITGWAGRVAPAVHYVTMAIAELAATVIPAAVALGSAGFVGLQGGQQMYTRFMAINDVMQSLGGAYGGTTGSFLGLQPKLQQLQDYAQGGVYDIAGAGINILKSGVGASFGQMGVQTIAMIDRGIADMQDNMAARGTGQQLGALLGGGTGYLRQFGDIASNLGNIVLGLAPHLPGVGGDWLSTVEGITGGLAGGIGGLNRAHLGDILGGLMAGEAGWRLGTPLVGLAGKGLTGLGGLAARAGLGALPLTEAQMADMAAATASTRASSTPAAAASRACWALPGRGWGR